MCLYKSMYLHTEHLYWNKFKGAFLIKDTRKVFFFLVDFHKKKIPLMRTKTCVWFSNVIVDSFFLFTHYVGSNLPKCQRLVFLWEEGGQGTKLWKGPCFWTHCCDQQLSNMVQGCLLYRKLFLPNKIHWNAEVAVSPNTALWYYSYSMHTLLCGVWFLFSLL